MRSSNWYSHHTYLQISEEPLVVLKYGIHAMCNCNCMLPVVIGHTTIVLLHRHSKSAELFKFKARKKSVWWEMRNKNGKNKEQSRKRRSCIYSLLGRNDYESIQVLVRTKTCRCLTKLTAQGIQLRQNNYINLDKEKSLEGFLFSL